MICVDTEFSNADCIICGHRCVTGVLILGRSICPECEAQLVTSKATSPGYDMYVKRLGAIWQEVFSEEGKSGGMLAIRH